MTSIIAKIERSFTHQKTHPSFMFSLTYAYKASKMFLKYPSAIPKLIKGPTEAGNYFIKIRGLRWQEKAIAQKKAYGFMIELNRQDIGVCPSIGIDGIWELEITELVKKILKKKMVFVDVGANIGWYSLLAAKRVGPEGLVLSFEPAPGNFSYLQKSIALNHFGNVKAFQQCISNRYGTTTLWDPLVEDNKGGYSIIKKGNVRGISVECRKLDDVLTKLNVNQVDLLKVDTEGAEPLVIEGASKSLSNGIIKNLIIEWRPEVWQGYDKLDNFLSGFEIYRFIQSPFLVKKVTKESLKEMLAMTSAFTNLYLRQK